MSRAAADDVVIVGIAGAPVLGRPVEVSLVPFRLQRFLPARSPSGGDAGA
jgi:hypothetical protein